MGGFPPPPRHQSLHHHYAEVSRPPTIRHSSAPHSQPHVPSPQHSVSLPYSHPPEPQIPGTSQHRGPEPPLYRPQSDSHLLTKLEHYYHHHSAQQQQPFDASSVVSAVAQQNFNPTLSVPPPSSSLFTSQAESSASTMAGIVTGEMIGRESGFPVRSLGENSSGLIGSHQLSTSRIPIHGSTSFSSASAAVSFNPLPHHPHPADETTSHLTTTSTRYDESPFDPFNERQTSISSATSASLL